MKNPPVIRMKNVSFRWSNTEPVLLQIETLCIAQGEHVFIKGPSGTGKTTLLNLLGGIIAPQNGQVSLLGENVSAMNRRGRDLFRADHMGVIFQMFNLVPYLSLAENVLLPCHFSPRRRTKAGGTRAAMTAEAHRLLGRLGLSTEAKKNRNVTQLSQGQQQRVAAARALIGRPELILADEPTSSLDQDVRTRFLDLLFQEADAAGTTIIFVSHDNTLEEMFPRSLALDKLNTAPKRSEETV